MSDEIIDNNIPLIEEEKNGYWEVFKDAEDKLIKRVWHPEEPNTDVLNEELNIMITLEELYNEEKEGRKAKGNFISLADGESFEGQFIKADKTTGQFGETNSFFFLVDGIERTLNSKSFKLLKNLVEAGVKEGDKARITKKGQGTKINFVVEKIA